MFYKWILAKTYFIGFFWTIIEYKSLIAHYTILTRGNGVKDNLTKFIEKYLGLPTESDKSNYQGLKEFEKQDYVKSKSYFMKAIELDETNDNAKSNLKNMFIKMPQDACDRINHVGLAKVYKHKEHQFKVNQPITKTKINSNVSLASDRGIGGLKGYQRKSTKNSEIPRLNNYQRKSTRDSETAKLKGYQRKSTGYSEIARLKGHQGKINTRQRDG